MDQEEKSEPTEITTELLINMHSLMMEALRHREQDIIRYLAILIPAFGGFLWILKDINEKYMDSIYIVAVIVVVVLLTMGGIYSLSISYNYRSVLFQKAKLEKMLGMKSFILCNWSRDPKDFKAKLPHLLFECLPYLPVPEIIRGPWQAFRIGIIVVVTAACFARPLLMPTNAVLIILLLSFSSLVWYQCKFGKKLLDLYNKENVDEWPEVIHRRY
jgi:hypothetical protein